MRLVPHGQPAVLLVGRYPQEPSLSELLPHVVGELILRVGGRGDLFGNLPRCVLSEQQKGNWFLVSVYLPVNACTVPRSSSRSSRVGGAKPRGCLEMKARWRNVGPAAKVRGMEGRRRRAVCEKSRLGRGSIEAIVDVVCLGRGGGGRSAWGELELSWGQSSVVQPRIAAAVDVIKGAILENHKFGFPLPNPQEVGLTGRITLRMCNRKCWIDFLLSQSNPEPNPEILTTRNTQPDCRTFIRQRITKALPVRRLTKYLPRHENQTQFFCPTCKGPYPPPHSRLQAATT